ncbi:MAG: ABC transporter ATP-binding protein [Clostridium sp.]
MSVISVKNVVKKFKTGNEEQCVLNKVSFEVEKGDFISIMGPSGCGKSTLLYLLGGLDSVSDGTISINGKDLSKLKEKEKSIMRRNEVGFVFQFYNLVPNLSVEDNIMVPIILEKKNTKDYKKKLDELLEITGLTGKKNMLPRELSGGQQQRVAIARALIFDPLIILADEPIGNLDSKTGLTIMSLFKDINKKYKTTIIQVTHSLESAKYGNKIINIRDGDIVDNH